MLVIDTKTQESLNKSLLSYYDALKVGDLQKLSTLMTRDSYTVTLESFGFKHVFKDNGFKQLLEEAEHDSNSLKKVETVISSDLKQEAREHKIDVVSFESRASDRITLHYTEDTCPKKMYYSCMDGIWKIDYKAGRKK